MKDFFGTLFLSFILISICYLIAYFVYGDVDKFIYPLLGALTWFECKRQINEEK